MAYVFVGTGYNQVYRVPMQAKQQIVKLGDKKRSAVNSIYCRMLNYGQIVYSNPEQFYELTVEGNNIDFSDKFLLSGNEQQKVLKTSYFDDRIIYLTNHGEIYYRKGEEQDKTWAKLYYNDAYASALKSLPPQKVGKLAPEYLRAEISQKGDVTVGFVGRGVLPIVYSFDGGSVIWKGKNVSNDQLDLQVPILDVDLCFINKGYHLVAANAQNKIRIYDVNSRRRKPLSDITLTQITKNDKGLITRICKSPCQKYLYVANDKGSLYQLDFRKNLGMTHKYKGVTATTIKDIKICGDTLAVVSLDGYLRMYSRESRQKVVERYLNTVPTVVEFSQDFTMDAGHAQFTIEELNLQQAQESEQQGKKPKKVKQIRKRNKVGLKYLQVSQTAVKSQIKMQDEQPEQKQERPQDQQDEDLEL